MTERVEGQTFSDPFEEAYLRARLQSQQGGANLDHEQAEVPGVRVVAKEGTKVIRAYDLGAKNVGGIFRMAGEGSGSEVRGDRKG